jgi:hypothetical protein
MSSSVTLHTQTVLAWLATTAALFGCIASCSKSDEKCGDSSSDRGACAPGRQSDAGQSAGGGPGSSGGAGGGDVGTLGACLLRYEPGAANGFGAVLAECYDQVTQAECTGTESLSHSWVAGMCSVAGPVVGLCLDEAGSSPLHYYYSGEVDYVAYPGSAASNAAALRTLREQCTNGQGTWRSFGGADAGL